MILNVETERERYLAGHCRGRVGFGGGSAIGCAKALDAAERERFYYEVMEETEGDDEEPAEVYIMKVVVNDDMEEFLPADEDKMPKLTEIVEQMFEEWDDDCDCDCDDECGDDCDCHHHE